MAAAILAQPSSPVMARAISPPLHTIPSAPPPFRKPQAFPSSMMPTRPAPATATCARSSSPRAIVPSRWLSAGSASLGETTTGSSHSGVDCSMCGDSVSVCVCVHGLHTIVALLWCSEPRAVWRASAGESCSTSARPTRRRSAPTSRSRTLSRSSACSMERCGGVLKGQHLRR